MLRTGLYMAGLLLACAACAQAAAAIQQAGGQFDRYSLGSLDGQDRWNVAGDSLSVLVQNNHVFHSRQAVQFKATGGRAKASKWVKTSNTGDTWVQFAINTPGATSGNSVYFTLQTRQYAALITLAFEPGGVIRQGSGRNAKPLKGVYTPGQWTLIGLVAHTKAGTVDVYINGQKTDASVPYAAAKPGQAMRVVGFDIKNPSNAGDTYIDDFVAAAAPREIEIDLNQVKKDLKEAYFGAGGGDEAVMQVPVDYQWLVTDGRDQFSQWCGRTGVRVWRLLNRHGWSIRGEQATKECYAVIAARKFAKNPKKMQQRYEAAMKSKRSIWFDPDKMFSFLKEHHIKVMPGIGARAYYDPEAKKAHWFVDTPKYYDGAAQNAAYYVQWAKDHGYLDNIAAWEIGNETYWYWKPEEFAAYAKKVIAATRRIDPNIKLAVSLYARRMDDPDAAWYKNASQRMERAAAWAAPMFKALGEDAKYITYGIVHLYGAERSYNTNYKGLEGYVELMQSIPNARHLRLICNEWRSRATENLTIHRRFDIGGLWKTKFSLLLMAQPLFDYSTPLSTFWTAGLGAYSDGHKWFAFQVHPDGSPVNGNTDGPFDYARDYMPNPTGERLALGPYAVPMRLCNSLIAEAPLMLQHHDDLGDMASAKFYESRRSRGMNGSIQGGEGLEWLISTNKDRTKLAAIVVNTKRTAQHLRLVLPAGHRPTGKAAIETYTCAPDKVDWTSTPGSISPKYDNGYLQDVITTQPAGQVLTVPAFSVTKVTIPLESNP